MRTRGTIPTPLSVTVTGTPVVFSSVSRTWY
jgi:hypothetical protein